ncbi:MAG TPA: hypothetical protein VHS34_03890 [Terriglobales bacterium]|nr:hypothetical protein [Terriglobales bacterium]
MIGCQAQSPQDQVLAVYGQMGNAVQSGDAKAFVALWSSKSISQAEKIASQLRPQPDVHYTASKVFVQGAEAALIGQYAEDGFLSMRFVREDKNWKIRDFAFSDKAYPAESVYAVVPPPAGAFERAGEPWQKITPGLDKANAATQGFQVRATYDESFLYIRIESSLPMPGPGTPAEKPPMGWPVMKVNVSGIGEFVVHAEADIGDQATFDKNGRANSHHHYVAYGLMLERDNKMLFQVWADSDPNPLIQAGDHSFEVRVPLKSMGIADPGQTKISIGDAQWPKSAVFSLEAQQYR